MAPANTQDRADTGRIHYDCCAVAWSDEAKALRIKVGAPLRLIWDKVQAHAQEMRWQALLQVGVPGAIHTLPLDGSFPKLVDKLACVQRKPTGKAAFLA